MPTEYRFIPESVANSSLKAEMPVARDVESNRLVDARVNHLSNKDRRLNLLTPGELDFIASILS